MSQAVGKNFVFNFFRFYGAYDYTFHLSPYLVAHNYLVVLPVQYSGFNNSFTLYTFACVKVDDLIQQRMERTLILIIYALALGFLADSSLWGSLIGTYFYIYP